MAYGPGASVQAWKAIVPGVELWEAEYDAKCVQAAIDHGQMEGLSAVTGDQGDPTVVQKWIQESGGNFDIIVDDGGHKNTQIKTSFDTLWPALRPGGLYFIEDLQVGRDPRWDDTQGTAVMADIIESWTEQLLISDKRVGKPKVTITAENRLPEGVEFIFCQHEACVLGKSKHAWPGAEWAA